VNPSKPQVEDILIQGEVSAICHSLFIVFGSEKLFTLAKAKTLFLHNCFLLVETCEITVRIAKFHTEKLEVMDHVITDYFFRSNPYSSHVEYASHQ